MEPDVDTGPWVVTEVDPAGMDIKRKKGRGAPIPRRVSVSNRQEERVISSGTLKIARARVSNALPSRKFDVCPVCLEPGPGTREDVPPASIGGDVLTSTCKRCNNMLGARVENHLVAWWHSELFDITVQAPGVPGPRSLGPTALRWMGDDVVLAPRRGLPPAFEDLPAGATRITALLESAREPDLVRVQLAVLKSSYLAACLALGGIPNSPCARAIRGGLLHVRDTDDLPTTGFRVPVRRCPGGETRQPSRLALIDGEVWVSLAGVLLTPWPICDVPPLWRGGTTPTQPVDASGCALAR